MAQIGTLKLVDSSGSTIEVAIHEPADFAGGEPLLRVQTDSGMGGISLKDLDMADTNYRVQTQNGTKALNTIVYDWVGFKADVGGTQSDSNIAWQMVKEDMTSYSQINCNYERPTTVRWNPKNELWWVLENDGSTHYYITAYETDGTEAYKYTDTDATKVQVENHDPFDIDPNDNYVYARRLSSGDWEVRKISYDLSNDSESQVFAYTVPNQEAVNEIIIAGDGGVVYGTDGRTATLNSNGSLRWENIDYGTHDWLNMNEDHVNTDGQLLAYDVIGVDDGTHLGYMEDHLDSSQDDLIYSKYTPNPSSGAYRVYFYYDSDGRDIRLRVQYQDGTKYNATLEQDVEGQTSHEYLDPRDSPATEGGIARIKQDQYGNVWTWASNDNPVVVYNEDLSELLYVSDFIIENWISGTIVKPGHYPAFESYW